MAERITADQVKLNRIYEPAGADARAQVLIDRLWRRRSRKADVGIDRRVNEIGPTTTSRKWPGYDPEFLEEFRCRYAAEVRSPPEPFGRLRTLAGQGIFPACGQFRNAAASLRNFLFRRNLWGKAKTNHR
ncbi:MAG: DUF488 family protein [Pseudomonadota bacterium]